MDETFTIDTRASFAQGVLWALQAADARGARSLCWVDESFADWPLGDPILLDTLTRWLQRPQRRLLMLAAEFDQMATRQPRFTAWRPAWSHLIEARAPAPEVAIDLPTLALDDGPVVLCLHDRLNWRGLAAVDATRARAWRDRIDVALQQSEPAWPVRPLGL